MSIDMPPLAEPETVQDLFSWSAVYRAYYIREREAQWEAREAELRAALAAAEKDAARYAWIVENADVVTETWTHSSLDGDPKSLLDARIDNHLRNREDDSA